MPEVSVVMSVYNNADELNASVNSVLSQESVDFEFIIINDGSSDPSGEILDEYAARDDRVRVIHQPNAGLTKALIRGCELARGEFIARQDADDISLPVRLISQLELLKGNSDIVMVSCWSACMGPKGEELFVNASSDNSDESTRKLLSGKQGPSAHGSVMFRNDAYQKVGGYRWQFYYAQDNDLWLRIGYLGKYFVVQEVLYRYKVCPKSISGSKRGLAGAYDRLAHVCHETRLKGEDESRFLIEAAQLRNTTTVNQSESSSLAMTYFIGRCLLVRKDRRAAGYFWSVIRQCPWHMRAWGSLLQLASQAQRYSAS